MFRRFWAEGLTAYDELKGIDWSWCATDGAMGKSPLGGGKTGPKAPARHQADTDFTCGLLAFQRAGVFG